jgi:hypothetical protein
VNPVGAAPPWLLKSSDIQYLLYEQAFGQHAITPLSCVVRMNVASGTGSKVVTHISKLREAVTKYAAALATDNSYRDPDTVSRQLATWHLNGKSFAQQWGVAARKP